MKILKKGIAPDGTHIQIEDWSEDYTCYSYGTHLVAYPRKYMRVRAEIQFEDHNQALAAFDELENGRATVLDMDFTVMKSANRVPLKPILENVMRKY